MKHDPATEKFPTTITNHPSFRAAEQIADSIPKEIIRIIEKSGYMDDEFEYLKGEAERVRKIYKPAEIIVGLKGDSGTGKSSLINCLLGYDGIAPSVCRYLTDFHTMLTVIQGAYADACTAVVQEFRKPRPFQKTPCEAEITFLQPQAREHALKDWIADFWDSHKTGTNEDQEEDDLVDEDCDGEVQNGESSATATAAIHSLFSDHEECNNAEATQTFLSSATSRGDPGLLAQLKAWTDKLFKDLKVESGKVTLTASMPEDLRDKLGPFLAKVPNQPSPWPLVKLVR